MERTATPEEAAGRVDAGGQERLPLLILVCGPPSAGKSTLAARLAQTLHLPVLHRDAIKSGLAEPRGITDPHQGRALAPPTFALFYSTIARFLDAGCSVIAEHAFQRGVSEHEVSPLLAKARTVIVHCVLPREENVRRAADRLQRGERHGSHPDAQIVEQMVNGTFDWAAFAPLQIGIPILAANMLHDSVTEIAERISLLRQASIGAP